MWGMAVFRSKNDPWRWRDKSWTYLHLCAIRINNSWK